MKNIKILFLVFLPLIVGGISLFLGPYNISPLKILNIFISKGGNIPERAVIIDIRFPRILLAGIVGASLSGSGVVLQGIFRNPLVDPFILGISAGAAFGCAITVGFFPQYSIQMSAFVFALVAVGLTYIISKTQGEISRLPLILSGIIVSAFFQALLSIIKFLVDPHKLQAIVFWLMGSFNLAEWKSIKIAGTSIFVGLLPIYLMRWRLNVLSLSEEEAESLGINAKKERLIFITLSTLAVAVATSVCGIIGWIGLMVPHFVRMMVGPDHRILFPLSLTTGAAFMISADTISRTVATFDVPVGIVTALIGAPFFLYLMKRNAKEFWGS